MCTAKAQVNHQDTVMGKKWRRPHAKEEREEQRGKQLSNAPATQAGMSMLDLTCKHQQQTDNTPGWGDLPHQRKSIHE